MRASSWGLVKKAYPPAVPPGALGWSPGDSDTCLREILSNNMSKGNKQKIPNVKI